ncbi:MAG: hypothetical protein ACKV2Q_11430 [Planctomycetaceae bacterium]
MAQHDLIEDFAKELFGASGIGDACYEELSQVVNRWIERVEEEIASVESNVEPTSGKHLDRLGRWFSRRRFAEFRQQVKPGTTLEAALLELFLQCRIRMHVLAYLSVQEGEDFEGAANYETRVPIFIAQLLRRLGRWSNLVATPSIGRLRIRVDIDPLAELRQLYGILVLSTCPGQRPSWRTRLAMAYHRFSFRMKTRILAASLRTILRRTVGRAPTAGVATFLRNKIVRRLLATAIFILFPDAKDLSESNWNELLLRIENYFVPRVADLLTSMPEQSVRDHGLIKLCKVAFGTIAGRTSVREHHEPDRIDFIFNTLRLAYSWGVTYPLVDNVLDSAATTPTMREQLPIVLKTLFASASFGFDEDARNLEHTAIREVHARLSEVLTLVPLKRQSTARRWLGNLLESHRRDSLRRLSTTNRRDANKLYREVMIDTALKSALVRLATMEVCGIEVDEQIATRSFLRSLFNQLGDDLWDIYEDADDDRVTPFTLHLTHPGTSDPFKFYLGYTTILTRGLSHRRQIAAMMGLCETLRDSLLALQQRTSDSLGVANAIAEMMDKSAKKPASSLAAEVPHVDFDAVLFSFERALFDLAPDGFDVG